MILNITFVLKFKSKYFELNENECWIWLGTINKINKYGYIRLNSRKCLQTHRASWLIHRGDIPNGLHVLHKCDNRLCVNPNHLFLGTALDNVRDCINKGRSIKALGEKVGSSKLTNEKVLQIRNLRNQGLTMRQIASLLNIAYTTVNYIINRKIWKHV